MSKKLKHTIYLLLTLALLNIASQSYYKRIDLTSDHRYTLAPITKEVILNVNKELIITLYLEGDFPSEFKRLQIETRQFLEELSSENSFIKTQFISPDSRRERLIKAGMIPSQLTVKENGKLSNSIIFPWAEITYKNKTTIVSLLSNDMVQTQEDQLETAVENLEFSFVSAILKLQEQKQKKVAILSGNGELQDIQLYSFLSEITKKYRLAKFTLDSVERNPTKSVKDLQKFDLNSANEIRLVISSVISPGIWSIKRATEVKFDLLGFCKITSGNRSCTANWVAEVGLNISPELSKLITEL